MVTLKEIAEEAGVSVVTVSNVLRGRNKENWPSTLKRADEIRAIAQRMGYRPHAGAVATATGRFGCVTLMLGLQPEQSNLPLQMLRGVHDELTANDMHLMLAYMSDEKLTDESLVPKILRQLMSDGLLIDYTHGIPERLKKIIHDYKVPSIWINSKQEFDSVYPDDFVAGKEATHVLVRQGHRHIAYVDFTPRPPGTAEHYSHADRRDGYEAVMQSAGLEINVLNETVLPFSSRVAQMKAMLSSSPRPTAVVIYGCEVQDLMFAAQALGLEVPRDLSVLTFGEASFFSNDRQVAMMQLPEYQIGVESVRCLMQKIERPQRQLAASALQFQLNAGHTMAPARSGVPTRTATRINST